MDGPDPAAVIPTLVQLGIERGLRRAGTDQAAGRDEMRALVAEMHAAAVGAIEKELVSIVARTREEIRR